ncbi:unnamed protein product [Linum trigynum]|uniref:Uncharacterized protein n=1 Tax=Linum trigynum TaxID=586398 RepID=A0AAV2GRX3_9ROSI
MQLMTLKVELEKGKIPLHDSGTAEVSHALATQSLKSKQGQKSLLDHLKYRYLGKDFNLPVIIPSSLTLKQEEYLLEALQYHLRLTKGSNMPAKKVIPNFAHLALQR